MVAIGGGDVVLVAVLANKCPAHPVVPALLFQITRAPHENNDERVSQIAGNTMAHRRDAAAY